MNSFYSLTSAVNNTAIGYGCLGNITVGGADYNTAVGCLALENVVSGAKNTGLGDETGLTLGSGSLNILIGYKADVPTAATSNYLNIGGAITGDMTTGPALMNGFTATTQSSSDSSTKIATTAFVQTVVGAITAGLDSRPSCRVATTAALTGTYSNGSSGVGATLTNNGTKAAISIDGVALSANDRVLVKSQTGGNLLQNGIYTVTTVGSGSVNWVLTRATDFNTASGTGVVEGAFTVIEEGTSNTGTLWIETGAGPFTIGTTAIVFTQLVVTQTALTNGHIFVGNGSSIAADVAMSGDVTITNAGVTSIKSNVALGGNPTTTTQSAGDNSTKIATTAYVDAAVAAYSATFNNQSGTTYTLASTDTGKTVTLNNASAITVTLPNSLSAGFTCECIQLGAGQVTFSAASGATLKNRQSFTKIAGQNGAVRLVVTGNSGGTSAVYNLAGDCA